ncbi:MAG: hypothetical protein AAF368_02175, partial [Planctomycetota bacterium]
STEVLRDVLREIEPDVVLTEIPPDRLAAAAEEYARTGKITEPRVKRFPEYTDALFPVQRELPFTIVPCAGWTREMAEARSALLQEWRETRTEDFAEMEAASAQAELAFEGAAGFLGMTTEDPRFIHTAEYDLITKGELEPYDRLFNDDLGLGGWTNINRAHYDLIEAAMDEISGQGRTVCLMFGAGHKYWFLEQLRERDDLELIDPMRFFGE